MMLSDRSVGWLRYLDGKAHTADRWDRESRPHPHWDGGGADLLASACALGLVAERTPAWTERHVAVLDQLIQRHTAWWSLAPWLGDGDEVPSDPVTGQATFGWAGSLLVLLGMRAALAADDPWNEPFLLVGEGGPDGSGFPWTHTGIARAVATSWPAPGAGDASQAIVAGLGLRLHDRRHRTALHADAFAPWWTEARDRFLDRADGAGDGDGDGDGNGTGDLADALVLAALLAPQAPDDARRLFDTAFPALGADSGAVLSPDQAAGAGAVLLLAREWGLRDEAAEVAAAVEASYQSTWDADGGHTWALEADEDRPRGRANAWLASAEAAGPGQWTGLYTGPWAPCHQVVGVDAPDVLLRRAEWIREALHVGLAPRRPDPARWTTFRITGAEPRMWYLTGLNGTTMDTAGNATIVRAPMVHGELEFAPGSY
ncbi:MAG: hypothetical protein R2761_10490 [Acidimicrobiales bacterium]